MANQEIRMALMENGIRLYKLARRLNTDPKSLSRELKCELPYREKKRLLDLIETMAREDDGIMKFDMDRLYLQQG